MTVFLDLNTCVSYSLRKNKTTIFVIIEEAKETILDFSQETLRLL